jgi:hypothetical protein
MRGRKNPGPVVSDSVRRAMRAVHACTSEFAAAALRAELRRVNKTGREKCQVKAHRANGQFEKRAKDSLQVPGMDGIENEAKEVEGLNEIEAELGGVKQ